MGTPIRISEAASLALHACLWLARDHGHYHTTREIGEELACSHAHLAKVMQDLARARIIESQRGPSGGVRLTEDPASTTLLTIYEAVEGRTELGKECLLPRSVCPGRTCVLGRAIVRLHTQFCALLAHTTLADILKPVKQEAP